MTVPLLVFARFRERAGRPSIEVPAGIVVSELREQLKVRWPELASLLDISRFAADNALLEDEYRIQPGDELALIPPVSGG